MLAGQCGQAQNRPQTRGWSVRKAVVAQGASMVRSQCAPWALAAPAPRHYQCPLPHAVRFRCIQVHRCALAGDPSLNGLRCGRWDSIGSGVRPRSRSLLIWARSGWPHSALGCQAILRSLGLKTQWVRGDGAVVTYVAQGAGVGGVPPPLSPPPLPDLTSPMDLLRAQITCRTRRPVH